MSKALGPFFGVVLPAQLKSVAQLLKKASELEQHDVVMCYFCLYQAVKQIMPFRSDPESAQTLPALLGKLEQLKPLVQAQLPSQETQQEYVTRFAVGVFDRANQEDLSGQATQRTAHNFYAASTFLSVLKVFASDGETLPEDIQEKSKYAKWKAADITTALREGRRPVPGGPDQESQAPAPLGGFETSAPQSISPSLDLFPAPPSSLPAGFTGQAQPPSASAFDFIAPPSQLSSLFPSTPTTQLPPPAQPQPFHQSPAQPPQSPTVASTFQSPPQSSLQGFPPAAPQHSTGPAVPTSFQQASLFSQPRASSPSAPITPGADKAIEQAQRFAKFAVSSLEFDDVQTAITNLEKSLELLRSIAK